MLPALKNNAAASYKGPVKIELLKGAGLLYSSAEQPKLFISLGFCRTMWNPPGTPILSLSMC